MVSIQALRERRNALAKDMKAMHEANTGKWDAALNDKWSALEAEITDVDGQISRVQAMVKHAAEEQATDQVADRSDRLTGNALQKAVFNKWLRGGDQSVTAQEWADVRNVMSTTTNTEGGYTVPVEVASSVIEALKAFGGVREVSQVLSTADGRDINFPTSDGTAEVGELIAQNTTATAADPVFGVATIKAYKYSSKIIAVPIELLQDTTIDMEAFVRARIVSRLGRIQNQHFTTGTGTAQPNGVVTAAASGKVGAVGQTLTVIYDDLVDLVHSVDPAYRNAPGKVGFMLNDGSIKVIRKLKDTSNRPIWTPSYESGITSGTPDNLLGYPVFVNQDVAAMAANAKSILFGNFNYYVVRDVMAMSLFRFTDSAYTKLGQVGFLAWMRADGNYIGVSGAIKFYANSAT